MTNRQKLETRQLEIQKRNAELSGVEELTDEQRGELDTLRTEYADVCSKLIAAGTQPEPTVETRGEDSQSVELRAMLHDAKTGNILAAVHGRRNTDGREAELQAHFKLAGNEVPHQMLEVRAQTQAPTNVATQQAEIIQPIFGMTAVDFLQVPMPAVEAGAAVYPIISTRPSVETPAEGATVTADIPAQTFAADLVKPQAAQAQVEFSREDAASFPSMGDALNKLIVDAVGFELDRQLLRHTDEGLLAGGLTVPSNPGGVSAFADYRKALNDQIDGRLAGTAKDCRVLLGSATNTHADTLFRGNQSEVSALDWLVSKSGGVRVHSEVPAVAAKRQDAIIAKALGQQHAVMPIWSSTQLVTDEVTKLQKRLIILTAIQLFSFKILRAEGFARVRFQHVA